eukprot:CAMPEP_0114265646 /NCGR_PEP_ID=MMETSP0058-20121206/24057_1 /TAXON_ID=36894 /ORGANISM="Pyramimonas parkeae, CCMP726" /LENGTH=289 /DNA_ID=CAMNT_0001382813 /DNA_START=75 /DNA_END=941 /DNA_ORIENTATION=-
MDSLTVMDFPFARDVVPSGQSEDVGAAGTDWIGVDGDISELPYDLEDEDAWRLLEDHECTTDEYLLALTGATNLETVQTLEVRVDSTAICFDPLAKKMPNLLVLKLNNSNIPVIRQLGTGLSKLTVLWISRSSVERLDGLGAMPLLRELYASFNDISDCSTLAECEHLELVDLEGNKVESVDTLEYVGMCPKIASLTVTSNPVASTPYLRRRVAAAVPQLKILDDVTLDASDRVPPPDDVGAEEEARCGVEEGAAGEEDAQFMAQLRAEKEKALRELALVSDGIKYAKV